MPAMRLVRSYVPLLAATVVIAGYFLFLHFRVPTLAFEARTYPVGFRDLVLDRTVSQPDPIFGVQESSHDTASAKPVGNDLCNALFRDPILPSRGNQDSPVQLATFFDYRCPYCKVLAGMLPSMRLDNVHVTYHEWAILGPPSLLAARAALAADRQGKYFPLHDRLMRARLVPTAEFIDAIATDLNLDLPQLHRDMNADRVTLALQRAAGLAAALGFLGTPALVVGRTIVQGEISRGQLQQLIEDEARSMSAKTC